METGQSPILSLEKLEKPYVGVLTDASNRALRQFMDGLRPMVHGDLESTDVHCGAFEVVPHGHELLLAKLDKPVYTDQDNPYPQDLPRAVAYFATHGESLTVPIAEVLRASGSLAWLQGGLSHLINNDWRVVISVAPYYLRERSDVGLHKDSALGNLMFFALLYCNDGEMMGPEYVLRPPMVPQRKPLLERNLQPAFLAAIEERLKLPMDYRMYAPRVQARGYILACDELMYHSTPFPHHRGAYTMRVFMEAAEGFFSDYFEGTKLQPPRGKPADKAQVEQGMDKLRALRGGGRAYIDQQDLKNYLPEGDFLATLVSKLQPGDDPFQDAKAGERDKIFHREMSDELNSGKPVPRPDSVDFLRIWVMAERRSPAGH